MVPLVTDYSSRKSKLTILQMRKLRYQEGKGLALLVTRVVKVETRILIVCQEETVSLVPNSGCSFFH